MRREPKEIDVAKDLASPEAEARNRAVAAFVRTLVASAPTELAILAAQHPEICLRYTGDRPLAQYLLEALPIPREVSLAWRIALLDGDALSRALGEFENLYGERLRRLLSGRFRDSEDVCQQVMARLLADRGFRRTFFGKYSGKGDLLSYMATVFIREACRGDPSAKGKQPAEMPDQEVPQDTEPAPDDAAESREFRSQVVRALAKLTDDPGLMPLLLRKGLDLTLSETAAVLHASGVNENALRQRIFRFRERLRRELEEERGERLAAGPGEEAEGRGTREPSCLGRPA